MFPAKWQNAKKKQGKKQKKPAHADPAHSPQISAVSPSLF